MNIFFGLQFDENIYRNIPVVEGGTHCFGPKNLLFMLESHLGLIGHPVNIEHLRIEQYRQCLQAHLDHFPEVFYAISFEADQLAAATRLLAMRDELYLAGFNFLQVSDCPSRIEALCSIEDMVKNKGLAVGFAERFQGVLKTLAQRNHPISKILLNEPFKLLPSHFQLLFEKLKNKGVQIEENECIPQIGKTDLNIFQNHLLRIKSAGKQNLQADGSLLILRAPRETDAAAFLAKLFRRNPDFRPICLIPEKNRSLDNALIQEGLPSLGILSASLARPSLQILKLVTAFLWQPIDPYKIMEFVSLSVKPLANDLADLIANLMAEKPGINSDSWRFLIKNYFEGIRKESKLDPSINVELIEGQYKFWFERKRYNANKTVPIKEVIEVFKYLKEWAFSVFEEGNGKNSSMQVLNGQARRIVELLDAQQENKKQLSHLELERIVRTIYEPSPVNFRESELGHLPFVYHPSAVIDSIDELVWWNFVRNEPEHFFSRWYQSEIQFLKKNGIRLQSPGDKNALLLWQRPRSVLKTNKRALLIIPEKVNGSEVYTHPLFDELEAAFKNLDEITLQINYPETYPCFEPYFKLPEYKLLKFKHLGKPKPFLEISTSANLDQKDYETFSSLDSLFYFPYQWVFKHKIKLRKSSILSIVKDVNLMGNLAHRFFELLFKQEINTWTKGDVETWIDRKSYDLLSKEGAVLLLYGREPEKVAFINRIKYAAWSLISMIQNNGWKVLKTEMDLNGKFMGVLIKGKADLVLQRGKELVVVDLKWRGATRRQNIIRNEEDLQLVTYSRLLGDEESWAHTAYFIFENAKMIARNNLAFEEVIGVAQDSDHLEINKNIWQKMQRTYNWRMQQLSKGQIEIRTEQTIPDLEDFFADELIDLLEMRDGNAPFDDYRTLINLVK